MKNILIIFCCWLLPSSGLLCQNDDIVVFQINSKWNSKNTRTDLTSLNGCEYRYGNIEDQSSKVIESITSVPVVVIYQNGIAKIQYVADISFKLNTPIEDIQCFIDGLRED